jgi:transposase
MHARSSLAKAQREAAVALFEKGIGYMATATLLGVSRVPIKALYGRWRIHGQGALVTRPVKSYSFEFKLALVERFLAGESGPDLVVEAGLASRELLQKWVRAYRLDGEDGLRPKPKGRPRKPDSRRLQSCPSLSGCGGRMNDSARRWRIWENCGP